MLAEAVQQSAYRPLGACVLVPHRLHDAATLFLRSELHSKGVEKERRRPWTSREIGISTRCRVMGPVGRRIAVKKHTSDTPPLSIPAWEALEGWIRDEIEVRIQSIAGEEVTQFLGRGWYERKGVVDAAPGYRNGYGKPRRLSTCCGTIKIKRPRVRGLKERFESRILPLFARHTKEVGALLPEFYLHGLAQGDFELALRGLLGDGAPLSSSSIARLRGQWETDYQTWQERRLDDRELVYAWADGIYVKAGLEKDKACLLVVIGATSDGRKEVLALVPGYRESTESWLEVLRGLRDRGLSPPALVVADGNMGIWSAVNQVWPQTRQQRCWNHKVLNVVNLTTGPGSGVARSDPLRQHPYRCREAPQEVHRTIPKPVPEGS